ncbi:MAG: alpha/beta fold hydrolase [Salibacteraceae bacterium]
MRTPIIAILLSVIFFFSCSNEEKNIALSFDNQRIYFTDQGTGKPTILFVHAWCTDGTLWKNQVEAFKKDYRVVTIDLAGHGKSGKSRKHWNPENFARDVVAVINRLELKKVVLVGHSISEETVIRVARMEPRIIVGIVGVDNFKDVEMAFNDSIKLEADRFFSMMDKNFGIAAEVYAYDFLFSPYTNGKIRNQIMDQVKASDPEIAKPILKILYTDYQEDKKFIKELITPLYLINSDFQPTDTAALGRFCYYGYDITYMSRVGHYPMIEKPKEFNEELAKILKKIEGQNFKPN